MALGVPALTAFTGVNRQARARAGSLDGTCVRAWHIVIVIVRIGSSFSFPGGGKGGAGK
jgi:hypothetical protein